MKITLDIVGRESARVLRVRDEYGREIVDRASLGADDAHTFVFWQREVQRWQDRGFVVVKIGPALGEAEMVRL